MRTALFISGLIILVFGLFFLAASINSLYDYKDKEQEMTEEQFQKALKIRNVSIIVTVAGLIIMSLATITKGKLVIGSKKVKPKQTEGKGTVIYCPQCGKRAEAGDKFCSSCGTLLSLKGVKSEDIRTIYVLINTEQGKEEYVKKQLKRLDEARRTDTLTGPYDNMVILEGESVDELMELVTNKLRKIPGVKQTKILVAR